VTSEVWKERSEGALEVVSLAFPFTLATNIHSLTSERLRDAIQEQYISVLRRSSCGGPIGVGILNRLVDQ
jgi:hypothetical protein